MFFHHPAGYITIGSLTIPLAEFMEYEPGYEGLPDGITSRRYEQNVRHALSNGQSVTGGPLSWPEGDIYLSREATYRSQHVARVPVVPVVPIVPGSPRDAKAGQMTPYVWPDVSKRKQSAPPLIEEMGYFGNIWVRRHRYARAGDVHEGHTHQFDHVSFLTEGAVTVQVDDVETVFHAPTFIVIKATAHHKITAIDDRTVWWCVFALRDLDGSVLEIFDPARHSPYGHK